MRILSLHRIDDVDLNFSNQSSRSSHEPNLYSKFPNTPADHRSSTSSTSNDPRSKSSSSTSTKPSSRKPSGSKSTSNSNSPAKVEVDQGVAGSTTPPMPPPSATPVGLPAHLLALLGVQTAAKQPEEFGSKGSETSDPRRSSASRSTSGSKPNGKETTPPTSILPPHLDPNANIPGVPKDFMASLASMLGKNEGRSSS